MQAALSKARATDLDGSSLRNGPKRNAPFVVIKEESP